MAPRKKETLDRISALPEGILLHILSFLPMHEVVKTSSLSKKWQYLWTTVPNLVFTNHKSLVRFSGFVGFVDQTLIQCRHSKIHRFSLNFQYTSEFDSRVNLWIRFATSCGVEELFIDIYVVPNSRIGTTYTLPQHTFNCSSLTNLKLSYCNVVPKGLITWNSLKNLWLSFSLVTDDIIHNILLGSPLLEVLVLNSCRVFKRLDIFSTSLRKLVINGYWHYDDDTEEESILEISAPNLHSLEITGELKQRRWRLVNMFSLVDANLSLYGTTSAQMCEELLQSLIHVKELTLGYMFIQVMSRLGLKHWPSLSKRKWLRLITSVVTMDSPGIEDLLQSSLDLETLIIDMPSSSNSRFGGTTVADCYDVLGKYWTSRDRIIFPCLQRRLKTFKIVGFNGLDLKHVLPFVEFLVKNACVLEKMVISTHSIGCKNSCCSSKELLEVAKKLLKCPRSSLNAVVLFT